MITPRHRLRLTRLAQLGGGLLAGAAILGGGYLAYHEHEKNEEEVILGSPTPSQRAADRLSIPSSQKKALTWELQNWLRDAQTRTDDFRAHGARGPTTWVLTEGHNIPDGAIVGGTDNGSPLYVARAFVEGGLQVGKAGRGLSKGASVGYKHKEYEVRQEIVSWSHRICADAYWHIATSGQQIRDPPRRSARRALGRRQRRAAP